MEKLPTAVRERIEAAQRAGADEYIRLNLGRMSLTEELLECVDWATVAHSVKVLDVSGNGLLSLPVSLGLLVNLEELIAYKNAIVSLPPRMFTSLRKLHTLLLSDNKLNSLPPAAGKLDALRVCDLSANRFASAPMQLGLCKNLVSLNMADNARMCPEHAQLLREGGLIPHLQKNPGVPSSLSLGPLLEEDSKSADLNVTFLCSDGSYSKQLHRCVVYRDPFFEQQGLRRIAVGDGRFPMSSWEMVLSFLYTGHLCVTRDQLNALGSLVEAHPLVSLKELVRGELASFAAADAEYAALVAQAKARNEAAPLAPPLHSVFLDGTQALVEHTTWLLRDKTLCDFEIVCSQGRTRRVHLPLLEVRLSGFVGVMLRSQWKECVERRAVFEDVDLSVVDAIVEWVHTDILGFDGEADLLKVLCVAQMYNIQDLAFDCQFLIGDGLDRENAPPLFQFASDSSGMEYLRTQALSYLKSHWFEMVDSQEFKALPSNLKAIVVGGKI